MNVLLTGATGFLGYRTLEKLISISSVNKIVATGRNLPEYRRLNNDKVVYKFGELEDSNFVNDIAKDVDVIINTASLSSPWGKRDAFVKANLNTQQNLIDAAKRNAVKRFIYISSPSIYYNGKDRWMVKESDPLPQHFANEYARTKYEAELLLVKSKLEHIILRPRALIGRGDSIIMPRLIHAYNESRLKVIGNGENVVDLTSVSNVADVIILSLQSNDNALNQAYNITNGEPVKLWQKISYVLEQLNKSLEQKKIPFWLVDSVARFLEIKSKLTNYQEPTLTRYGVGTLAKNFTLDIQKAKSMLGYTPHMTTDEAIQEFTNWYLTHEKM